MKTKTLLYVDVPFIGLFGGDKNRSSFLYESLKNKYDTDILLIQDKHYSKEIIEQHRQQKLYVINNTDSPFYFPNSVHDFLEEELNAFKEILLQNQYDTIFFKFNSMAVLARFAKKILPFSNIIIDVDMLSSRICYEAWKNKPTLKNRYFLLEYLKLNYFEKRFLNENFTYLYTNKTEMLTIRNTHTNKKQHKHLPNVFKEQQDKGTCTYNKRFILFYGMLNSTVNQTAYIFLKNEIYPLIKTFLQQQDIHILVIGKNKTSTYDKELENITVLGEVDNLTSYIKKAEFVFLPLKIASGTLTRVLEAAFLKKAVLTTSIGAEGLNMDKALCIEDTASNIALKTVQLLSTPNPCQNIGTRAYDHVKKNHSSSEVSKKLYSIIEHISNQKINVIHIPRRFTKSHWGGTENVIMSYALGLKEFHVNSEVYTTSILNSKKEEHLQGVKIRRFSYFYPYFNLKEKLKAQLDLIGGNIFSFTLLFSLLFKANIDLIHLHTFKRLGGIARLICKLRKIPYIVSIHGGVYNRQTSQSNESSGFFKSSFEWGKILGLLVGSRRVIQDANATICLNQEEYSKLKEKENNSNIFLLENSVDIKLFAKAKNTIIREKFNLGNNAFICLVSARIDPQKNQLLLLNVINNIKHLYKNIHVLLVGNITDESYHTTIVKYIQQNNLKKHVTIITNLNPQSQELINMYLNADVLVLPSNHEPFGIVALEAWAASLPVIISDIAGICNVMEDKKDALIFKNESITSLQENLSTLISNKILGSTLIKNARQSVLSFDTQKINSKLYSIYKKVIQKT